MATYTPQTEIAGPSLGSADAWYAWARDSGAARLPDVRLYLDTLYEWAPTCNLKAHVLVCQSIHETSTEDGPWTSYWFRERLNPSGLGVTGDPTQNAASKMFASGREAALAHIVHAYLYVKGKDLPAGLRPDMDPRWNNAASVPGIVGRKTTLGSFGNDGSTPTWAVDPQYGTKWAGWLNRTESLFEGVIQPPADDSGNEQEAPMAGYKAHDWSHIGFPGGKVYLPDWIPVEIKIIPSSVAGWTSGQKLTGQTSVSWHDTGNPNSSASSEWSWANGGGRAGINSPGSYNGIYDKNGIIIAQRFDELVGHAGVPAGNRTSWAFEQAYGPGFDASLPVGVALFGGIIAAMGWSVDTALRKHQDWSQKWCPAQILNRGMWPQVQAMVAEAARKARAAADGVDPASPIAVGATVATTVNLYLRPAIGTTQTPITLLPAGAELEILNTPASNTGDGYTWWRVKTTDGITGYVAEADTSGTVPYLVVTKPAPSEPEEPEPPAYANPLAIAELAPYVGRPIVPMPTIIELDGGDIAIPVFDRFRTVRETRRRQNFIGPEDTGPMLKPDEEFDGSFVVIGEGHEPTLVTHWWTRILLKDLKVISDVPRDLPAAEPEAA